MKRLFVILSLISLLFVACNKPQPEPVIAEPEPLPFEFDENLQDIDSLLQHNAANALQELLSSDTLPAIFNGNYYQLLLSEALYKTDNPQYYRNELQAAMQFFDSLAAHYPTNDDLTVLSARSHYMNGVGFYENDSIVEACKEYLYTLEIMENHFNVETLRGYRAKFMGLTYNRLSELFSDKFMLESSIYCDKHALFFCKLMPTSHYSVPNIYYRIGKKYDMLHQIDSAYAYYNLALEHLPDSNNIVYRSVVTNLNLLLYSMNDETDVPLYDLKKIINQTDNEHEKLKRYIAIGYIYYKEKVYDSAAYYFEKVFDNETDEITKFTSAMYLHDIYLTLEDTVSSNKYIAILAKHATSTYDNMMEVSTLDEIFQDYLKKQQNKKHNHNVSIIIKHLILLFAIILLFIILISYIKNSKTTQKVKLSEQKLINLKKEYEQQHTESEDNLLSFLNEPVCKKINNTVFNVSLSSRDSYVNYPHIWLDNETITVFIDTTTKHFPDLKTILITKNKNLRQEDLLICYLSLLGLNFAQIAILTKYSYSSIRKRALRLQKALKTSTNLPTYIRKLLFLE